MKTLLRVVLWLFSTALGLSAIAALNGAVSWRLPATVAIGWAIFGYQQQELYGRSFGWPFNHRRMH